MSFPLWLVHHCRLLGRCSTGMSFCAAAASASTCLASLLAPADYLCPSSPPISIVREPYDRHPVRNRCFLDNLVFLYLPLVLPSFCGLLLSSFIFGTLLDSFSSCRVSSLSLHCDIHRKTTKRTIHPRPCCSCLDFSPRLLHQQSLYNNLTILIACCCLPFLIFRHHRLPTTFLLDQSTRQTFTSVPPASPFTRPSPLAFPNGLCILRMPRYYYTLIF